MWVMLCVSSGPAYSLSLSLSGAPQCDKTVILMNILILIPNDVTADIIARLLPRELLSRPII